MNKIAWSRVVFSFKRLFGKIVTPQAQVLNKVNQVVVDLVVRVIEIVIARVRLAFEQR